MEKQDYGWLEKWTVHLKDKRVLELGCGSGIDTRIISNMAQSLVATDIAPTVSTTDFAKILTIDHSKALPFDHESFDTVVSSLSLHYFNHTKTRDVLKEIGRVLVPNGSLICRVNSTKDVNHGVEGFPEIEDNVYLVDGKIKHFFDESSLQILFADNWEVKHILEKTIDRYEKKKVV